MSYDRFTAKTSVKHRPNIVEYRTSHHKSAPAEAANWCWAKPNCSSNGSVAKSGPVGRLQGIKIRRCRPQTSPKTTSTGPSDALKASYTPQNPPEDPSKHKKSPDEPSELLIYTEIGA